LAQPFHHAFECSQIAVDVGKDGVSHESWHTPSTGRRRGIPNSRRGITSGVSRPTKPGGAAKTRPSRVASGPFS
jgi:hypothetical protein